MSKAYRLFHFLFQLHSENGNLAPNADVSKLAKVQDLLMVIASVHIYVGAVLANATKINVIQLVVKMALRLDCAPGAFQPIHANV